MKTAISTGLIWLFMYGMVCAFITISVVVCYFYIKNLKKRRRILTSNPLCFQLVTDKQHVHNAVALTTALCGLVLAAFAAFSNAASDDQATVNGMRIWFIVAWLILVMIFVGYCADYLTRHLCFSDLYVKVQSLLSDTQEKALNWKQITSVEIHHHPSDSSKLRKVVISGDLRTMPIVITGNHPQINTIIQLIKDKVPDKLTDISDTQTKTSSRILKVIKGTGNIIAFAWSFYLLTIVLNIFSMPSASSITSANRLYTATIWVFAIWKCAPNLINFAVNYRRRQNEFAESTACYPLLSHHQRAVAKVVFAVMIILVSAICLFILVAWSSAVPIAIHTAAVVFMLSVVLGTLKFIHTLTERICIDDKEVCVKSLVANSIETHINWQTLASIDVVYDPAKSAKISEMLLSTAPPFIRQTKKIMITGENEHINQINIELRQRVPEKFGVISELTPVMPDAFSSSNMPSGLLLAAIFLLGGEFFLLVVMQNYVYPKYALWAVILYIAVYPISVFLYPDIQKAYDTYRYWQVRMYRISAAPYSYKLNKAVASMRSLRISFVIYELVLLLLVVLSLCALSHQSVWHDWIAMPIAVYPMLAFEVPLYWLYYFTAHYCIDKRGNICTSASLCGYNRAIRWDELTKLTIEKDHRSPSGISSIRLVTTTPQSSMTISGKHPDIITIMQHIRDNAPDVFNAKTDETPVR